MIMLVVRWRMWSLLLLTPLLLSRCCTDTPNQQSRSDFILPKSNILNVFSLGSRRGYFIDSIPWFCWWRIVMGREV
jgi:hypothetical protein